MATPTRAELLEQVAVLERTVRTLTVQNTELTARVTELTAQVSDLSAKNSQLRDQLEQAKKGGGLIGRALAYLESWKGLFETVCEIPASERGWGRRCSGICVDVVSRSETSCWRWK